jgi:hypothetical protein
VGGWGVRVGGRLGGRDDGNCYEFSSVERPRFRHCAGTTAKGSFPASRRLLINGLPLPPCVQPASSPGECPTSTLWTLSSATEIPASPGTWRPCWHSAPKTCRTQAVARVYYEENDRRIARYCQRTSSPPACSEIPQPQAPVESQVCRHETVVERV